MAFSDGGEAEMHRISKKKVLFIVAHENFRDEELEEPKRVLGGQGADTIIASSQPGMAEGMLGDVVKADLSIKDVKVGDYDAVIFIGGVGAEEYWDDPTAHAIARESVKQNIVLGAICIAPVTLARAGVLHGKRATAFNSVARELEKAGARYTGTPVERDGLIITADGPANATQFGGAVAEALAGRA
ncbi:MAG: DJ-1/PfpI family protein [Candidatus Omnitrophica bacterium]|nr:DJ-1/PfpI family protein [Candidatus Omnitrophota bacterium]